MIQVFSNTYSKEEEQAVKKVLRTHWTGYGPESKNFEKEFGAKIVNPYTLVTNTCTATLFMSIKILGIKNGDEVILPTVHFPGCANAIMDVGAKPIFADVDSHYLNIAPSEIKRLKTKKTKAVLILHYGGHPADFDTIKKEARGLKIIEDSANSPFSKYKGKNCGTLGDLGCFSFDAMKILTMGDGGAITCSTEDLYEKAKMFRYLGFAPKESSGVDALQEKKERWWNSEVVKPSNRYTPNDILSSIGRIQLKKVDNFINKRKKIWKIYQKELANIDYIERPPEPLKGTESSYYLYWIRVKNGKRDKLAKYMVANDVYVTFRYFPLHLMSVYGQRVKLPVAEKASEEILNLPLHQNLTKRDLEYIVKTLKKFR